MKRVIAFFLTGVCALGVVFTPVAAKAYAEQNVVEITNIKVDGVWKQVRVVKAFEDGSRLYEEKPAVIQTVRGGVTSQKAYHHINSSGNRLWSATVVGSFTYNGSTSSCTSASCSTTIYNGNWSEQSCSAYPSGNTATGNVTMIRKVLFIVLETVPVTITLTCDKNGNLS